MLDTEKTIDYDNMRLEKKDTANYKWIGLCLLAAQAATDPDFQHLNKERIMELIQEEWLNYTDLGGK